MDVLWADGRLRDPADPVVGGLDRGLAVGLGAFETCAVVAGQAFALTRHLVRLAGTLDALGLPGVDDDEVRAAVAAVLDRAGDGAGRLRLTVTAGPPGASRPTLLVSAGPAPVRGVPSVVRSRWVRNERSPLAGHKSTSYAADVLALAEAVAAGGDEAVLADTRGRLAEGATSNVFVEVDGELLTPSTATGCLPGVTRALVLAWSADAGLPVREAGADELPWEVLDRVAAGRGGLALSGSLRGFVPVRALDGVGLAGPTPLVARVQTLVTERMADDVDP